MSQNDILNVSVFLLLKLHVYEKKCHSITQEKTEETSIKMHQTWLRCYQKNEWNNTFLTLSNAKQKDMIVPLYLRMLKIFHALKDTCFRGHLQDFFSTPNFRTIEFWNNVEPSIIDFLGIHNTVCSNNFSDKVTFSELFCFAGNVTCETFFSWFMNTNFIWTPCSTWPIIFGMAMDMSIIL